MYFISILLFLTPLFASAQEVWIQGQKTDAAEFESFLSENLERTSWLQKSVLETESKFRTLQDVLPLASLTQTPTAGLIKKIRLLESQNPWSVEAVLYLRDYFLQAVESQSMNAQLQDQYRRIYCHYQVLLQEPADDINCQMNTYNLSEFKKINPDVEVLFMNQLRVILAEQSQLMATPDQAYQWTALSNRHHTEVLNGKAEDILSQKIALKELISGNCREFDSDLTNKDAHQVYFSKNCQRPLSDAGLKAAWYYNKAYWLVGLGVVASVLYFQDKTVQITLPF